LCLLLTVPSPYNVSIKNTSSQIVGQSLTLECSVTTVRGITSRVDIVWSSENLEAEKIENVNVTYTSTGSAVYKTTYTIPLLSTTDDGRVYQCEVVINTTPLVFDSSNITLEFTGLYLPFLLQYGL